MFKRSITLMMVGAIPLGVLPGSFFPARASLGMGCAWASIIGWFDCALASNTSRPTTNAAGAIAAARIRKRRLLGGMRPLHSVFETRRIARRRWSATGQLLIRLWRQAVKTK